MKKLLTLSLFVAIAAISFLMYENTSTSEITENVENQPKQEHRGAAVRWNMMRANPETGKVEIEDVKKAQAEIAKFRKENATKAGSIISWDEMGPNNVGGRTRAIHFDNSDSNIMYTGGVTGGLWKSMDGSSSWELLQNSVDVGCTNVTSITQTDDGTLYVGTGSSFEFVFEDTQANVGTGVFKSSDGGETLIPVPATASWQAVNRLASNGSRLFAATNSGLYTSTDGNNWSKPTGVTSNSTASDVHVTSDGNVFAAVGNGIHKSTDGGVSFSQISNSNFVTGATSNRKVIKSCDAEPNVLYMAYLVNSCTVDIYKSTDTGDTWSRVVAGNAAFTPVGVASAEICQGNYDLALSVSPTNSDEIFVGGLTLWKWSSSTGAYQVDNYYGGLLSDTYVHADKHVIEYKPGSGDEMFIGCDGGIFKTSDASSDYPVYQHKSKGLNTVQFYSIGTGLDGSIIGGAQDNGTSLLDYSFQGLQAAQGIAGGDGGYCEISQVNPRIMLASSQSGNIVLSTNGGEGFGGFLNGGTPCDGSQQPTGCGNDGPDEDGDGAMDNANFIQAFELWEDTELYYTIMNTEIDPVDIIDNPVVVQHNGQLFEITSDLDKVAEQKAGNPGNTICFNSNAGDCIREDRADNWDNYQTNAVNVYKEPILYIGYDVETQQIIPSPKFVRSKLVLSNTNGDMWITYDLLNLGVTPFFVHLGRYDYDESGAPDTRTAGGNVQSMAFSKDGDHVYFGTTNGKITRVSGLNDEPTTPVTFDTGNQVITGLSVNDQFPNQVIASAGGFGSGDHIYRSVNATTASMEFESIQGNLPQFPVYDCGIIGTGPLFSDLIVGGEYGVWFGQDLGGGNIQWTEENGKDGELQLGIIPVERIRIKPMARNNSIPDFKETDYLGCKVVYIGTHGRGAFRTTSFADGSCADAVAIPAFAPTNNSNIDIDVEFNVYPNPASSNLNVDFAVEEPTRVKVNIYDIQGRLITTAVDMEAVGNQTINVDLAEFTSGNYIVSLQTINGVVSKQISIVK